MKVIAIHVFILFGIQLFANEHTFHSADSAYQAHDYSLAINLYTQVLAESKHSAPLYYNLGNAYYKNNEIGKSIWAYQKANKIDPQQKDIAFNLNFVSNLTKDKIEQSNQGFSKWIAKVFYGRSINFWSYFAFICITLSCLFYYLFKITIPKNKRSVFLLISFSTITLFLICISFAIAHRVHITTLNNGIIIESTVKAHTAPSAENAVAFELHEGAKFTYKENQGNWYRIEVGKNEGWILKETSLLY